MKVRPVELRFGFIHPDLGVLPIDDGHGAIFHEIKKYYGDSTLDPTGMKLKGGAYERRFSGGGFRNNNRRRRGKRRR